MVAFILAELDNWSNKRSRRTLSRVVYSYALIGFITQMRPDLYFFILVAVFIWLGIQIGSRGTDDFEIFKWIRNDRLSLYHVIIGKIIAAVMLSLVHIAILLPLAIFISLFWGITWNILCFIYLILIATATTVSIFEMMRRETINQ
jgi:hypothetical protein